MTKAIRKISPAIDSLKRTEDLKMKKHGKQRVIIDLEYDAEDQIHWVLVSPLTDKVIRSSRTSDDRLPFATTEQALRRAAKVADDVLWLQRSCAA